MNREWQLKIQAFADHELPPHEALEVADRIVTDADSKKLVDELRQAQALMAGNELQPGFPASPDFFWSQIEREIHGSSPRKEQAIESIELSWIWRLLAPASALLLLAILILPQRHSVSSEVPSIWSSEVETAIQDANVITFRSDSEGVSVVWVDMN